MITAQLTIKIVIKILKQETIFLNVIYRDRYHSILVQFKLFAYFDDITAHSIRV